MFYIKYENKNQVRKQYQTKPQGYYYNTPNYYSRTQAFPSNPQQFPNIHFNQPFRRSYLPNQNLTRYHTARQNYQSPLFNNFQKQQQHNTFNNNINSQRNQKPNFGTQKQASPLPPVEPMEISSGQSRLRQSTLYRPSNWPNQTRKTHNTRQFQEMNNINTYNPIYDQIPSHSPELSPNYTNTYQHEDQNSNIEDQQALDAMHNLEYGNFHLAASNNQSDS